jgi:peptidoglycan/xylan/chitin deacetylase (PgdA/CDA1 family)
MKGTLTIAVMLALPMWSSGQQPAPDPLPGAKLSVGQIKEQFLRVSAGKRLKPKSWPDGARVAVALSFDVDNATHALARGLLGANELSVGEYGAIDGLPRILRVLDKYQVPASFFIPAVSDLLHPQMIRDIMASGRHEIGVHGWIHEDLPALNNETEERRLLHDAIESLTKSMGKRPAGYRAPSWAFSQYTMQQVKEAGFLYDSSLMASDDAYEVLVAGQPTGVVEVPIGWILDDYAYFGGTAGTLPSPGLVLQIYESEFDAAYEEGGLFVLTMHPHITGHRSRAAALDQLIAHMRSRPDVWFATHEQVARYVRSQAGL